MKCAVVLLSLFLGSAHLVFAQDTAQDFTERVKRATALLYSQDSNGGMTMRCTVTAFDKSGDTYKFVTAAHCLGSDDTQKERVVNYRNIPFYITFDESGVKQFHRAEVHSVGYQHRGDDFAVFLVKTKLDWPTIPVGDERKEVEGASVLNVASPLGLGLQVFRGHISKLELDRPIIQGDINWKGTVLLQMPGTNGGSSGSSVISVEQGAIVAFLVGTIGGTSTTAIPATRFTAFQKLVADEKYRWARIDE